MNSFFVRETLDGMSFTTVKTDRFHTSRLSVNLIVPMTRESVTAHALIAFLLRKGCRKYPDFSSLNRHLNTLSGAVLDTDIRRYADSQIVSVTATCINSRFSLNGEDILSELAELICDLLTEPTALFDEKEIAVEKKVLKETIESVKDDKSAYVIDRLFAAMFAGKPEGIPKYGFAQDLDAINADVLKRQWENLLKNSRVEIIASGQAVNSHLKDVFAERLCGSHKKAAAPAFLSPREKPVFAEETSDVMQSKIAVGFTAPIAPTDPDFPALQLFNAVFGATTSSRLFLTVREKMNLCYYCSSALVSASGVLIAYSGVEEQNREKTVREILRQQRLLAEGTLTEEELQNAGGELLTTISSVTDSLAAMENWALGQILQGTDRTPAAEAERLRRVTVDDVTRAANRLLPHTVFSLIASEESV